MKILCVLKPLWSSTPAVILRWAIGILTISVVVTALLVCVYLWSFVEAMSNGCPHNQLVAKIPGVSGFDFEVRFTDCWIVQETGVFASRSGQRKKVLVFLYSGFEIPGITAVDERTVQITLTEISGVYRHADKWRGLKIKYNIPINLGARSDPAPPECGSQSAAAQRQTNLACNDRSLEILITNIFSY